MCVNLLQCSFTVVSVCGLREFVCCKKSLNVVDELHVHVFTKLALRHREGKLHPGTCWMVCILGCVSSGNHMRLQGRSCFYFFEFNIPKVVVLINLPMGS